MEGNENLEDITKRDDFNIYPAPRAVPYVFSLLATGILGLTIYETFQEKSYNDAPGLISGLIASGLLYHLAYTVWKSSNIARSKNVQ